jgi:hypothetical protein
MKKSLWLVLFLMLICMITFSACDGEISQQPPNGEINNNVDNTHTHSFGEWKTSKHATCIEQGKEVRYCPCGEQQENIISATGHSFGEWTSIQNSTCFQNGKQERICECGEKETHSLPLASHSEVTDNSVAPTCTATGLTEGKHCSVCNRILVAQQTVSKIEHSFGEWTTITASTCTQKGERLRFCDCGERESQSIDTLPHSETTDKAVAPTCTTTGLTEGKHCAVCKTVIVAQTSAPALGHTYDDVYDTTCNHCDHVREAKCAHPQLITLSAKPATCTDTGLTEGKQCANCGEILTQQQIIPLANHTRTIDHAVDATCTTSGLTEGEHCSVCNKILIAQTSTSALDHVYDDIYDTTCNRCEHVREAVPKPVEGIQLISLTSPAFVNNPATIKIQGKANTEYTISVYYSTGASTAKGLEAKTSDANGVVSWTWKVGGRTKPGNYRIVIKGGGETFETYFTVA